ncbi:MAG: hypothetical protein DMF56_23040 [Acidobacteria bacterium]|nr:MAG: hypothetical protein DMF56_23040 [Acidobacteriota bacterium]
MSTIENGSTVPTPNYVQTAQARLEELRVWREQIPRFVIPPTSDATKRLSIAASVPAAFIELTNVAVTNQKALVREERVPPAEIRDLMSYADAYSPVADELEALAQFVRHSVTAARNTAGSEALTTYSLAQRLAKKSQHAHLVPYVADMRRALGRVKKLTPEEAAQKATERAAKATAKVAKATAKAAKSAKTAPAPPANPAPTTQQPS